MSIIEQALNRVRKTDQEAGVRRPSGVAAMVPAAGPRAADVPAPVVPRRTVKVDLTALRSEGLLPPAAMERQVARQFRRIKRPLIERVRSGSATAGTPSPRMIMVASALPGEGKSFCTLNLALSFVRERDFEFVIVDADVAKANISRALGLTSEPGLMEALKGDPAPVESLVLPTDIENLSVLPAGRQDEENATELLSSAAMSDFIARLASRPNRIVLFDSPPLLLTTESHALAGAMGQIVFIVRAASTPRQAVQSAVESLGEQKSIGFILNQCEFLPPTADYYYYGYGEPAAGGGSVPDSRRDVGKM